MTEPPESSVEIAVHEREALREVMHDTQKSVADYYSATAKGDDLGSHVRAFLSNAQALNELLTNAVADSSSYLAALAAADRSDADLVFGVKYARNVAQHVLHVIRPSDDKSLVGGTFGMRVYALWDEVPPAAHAKLHSKTKLLKDAYVAALHGKEVTSTMLGLLRFYGRIAPSIVHRDQRGEWTGFPLMSQPAVLSPLHPEEPLNLAEASIWLNDRLPGGDSRLVCGQISLGGMSYVFGRTFVGRYSFAPFVESVEQVNKDISAGYVYLAGDLAEKIEDVSNQFPRAQAGALASSFDPSTWASAVTRVEPAEDWCADASGDEWHRMVRRQHASLIPENLLYGLRRAQRLNALVPPSE